MDAGDWIAAVAALVSTVALTTSIWTYRVTRNHLLLERVHRLSDRLYELDRLVLEHPGIQKLLYEERRRESEYFVPETRHDETDFLVKTFVYTHINLFDEIFCVVSGNEALEKAFEFPVWQDYIIRRLRHPLFRELLTKESSIWGTKFQAFIEANRERLLGPPDDDMY